MLDSIKCFFGFHLWTDDGVSRYKCKRPGCSMVEVLEWDTEERKQVWVIRKGS